MKLWIDAQLSPALAPWICEMFPDIEATSLKWLGMRDATDIEVFHAAREADAVILSKDVDFIELLKAHSSPQKIIWLTCGNTSNQHLKNLLVSALPKAIALLDDGESLVEIR